MSIPNSETLEQYYKVKQRFKYYFKRFPAWGSLHVVAEGNYRKRNVGYCLGWAESKQDWDGASLARELMQMTPKQMEDLIELVEFEDRNPGESIGIK